MSNVDSVNRRTFIDHSSRLGAAAALGLSLAAHSTAAQEESSPGASAEATGTTVTIGVMGLSRGSQLATGFAALPGVRVKYLCDVDNQRAEACANRLRQSPDQQPEIVTDYRRILDDPQVDALICAAPNHWHAPATIAGCQAGKHVYVEKPCCHNPQEGEWMVEVARKHNRCVQMGTQRRSSPGWIEAMQKLHAGAIGDVRLARCWYYNLRGTIGKGTPSEPPAHLNFDLWQGPAPRRPYQSNLIHYNWHWRWHWGNGELGNNGVHTLDLARWGLGVDFPTRVTSAGGRYFYQDDQETPDTHTVCLEFPGGKMMTWEGLSCNRNGDRFVAFYGSNGAMECHSDGRYVITDTNNKEVESGGGGNQGDKEHLQNFVNAIRSGDFKSLHAEIEIGYRSTLLCHLGNIAHRVGDTLTCDPSSGKILDNAAATKLWRREYEPGWEISVS
jgi:predicted dehydrogenase